MHRHLIALLLLASACSTQTATTTTTAVATASTIATTTSVLTAAPTTTASPVDSTVPPTEAKPTGDIFLNTELERFRSATEILLSRDEAGSDVIISSSIAAAYVREPESIEATVTSGDQVAHVIGIGETFWIDDGAGWQENAAAEQLLSLTSVTALTPDTLGPILLRLTNVGVEELNGRQATHYQGGIADVRAWLGGSPELDQFAVLDLGSIDVWVDEAGFVSKAAYVFGGTRVNSSATEFYRATFELFDFDADFEVNPPA